MLYIHRCSVASVQQKRAEMECVQGPEQRHLFYFILFYFILFYFILLFEHVGFYFLCEGAGP